MAKASMRVSGGTPAGYPDFVPLNPWGRGFPAPPRPYREGRERYQLVVKDARDGNKETPIGPQWEKREFAEMMCVAVNSQIATGAEKRWSDPAVVKMS